MRGTLNCRGTAQDEPAVLHRGDGVGPVLVVASEVEIDRGRPQVSESLIEGAGRRERHDADVGIAGIDLLFVADHDDSPAAEPGDGLPAVPIVLAMVERDGLLAVTGERFVEVAVIRERGRGGEQAEDERCAERVRSLHADPREK